MQCKRLVIRPNNHYIMYMMTNTPQETISHNQQSQLAKLLAMENITVRHDASAKTAMFDVKNRVLILPVWRQMSKDLYDMLVIHEVGHALDTPCDGWVDSITDIAKRNSGKVGVVKGYLNVIEDARIDKRQKRRYPGSRRNYVAGYKELIDRNFFGTKNRDVNSMTFIDRINIHFKAGAMSGVKFSPEELKFIKRIELAETFEEVIALTEEIFKFAKEKKAEDEQEIMEDDFMMGEDGEGEESEDREESDEDSDSDDSDETSNDSNDPSDEESDEDSDENGDGESDEDSEDDDSDDSEDEDSDDDSDDIGAGSDEKRFASDEEDDVEMPETEKAWQEKQEELLANSNFNYVYVTLPKPHIDQIIDDYKVVHAEMSATLSRSMPSWVDAVRDELNKFRASENASISYMVKEFEMRKAADEYQRTSISKTGVLDTNKIHSYKYNDDIFRKISSVSEGKNHGFVMFIDWSGSMDIHLKKTLKQLFSLTLFCKRVQIPFEVYSFRTPTQWDKTNVCWSYKQGDVEMKNFRLRNILSSRMNTADFNRAMLNLYAFANGAHYHHDTMGSTPLNEAIVCADYVVNAFKARTKVQVVNTIFLTDGCSDGNTELHKTPSGVYGINSKKNKYIIQDEVTKKDYELGTANYGFYFGNELTNTFLHILKSRTGCNLIGFYIYASSFRYLMSEFYGRNTDSNFEKSVKKSFEDDGFVAVTTSGYDEYYILHPQSMEIRKNQLAVDSSMTKNKIAKAFISFAEKKAVNRVLLQRFVKRIAA